MDALSEIFAALEVIPVAAPRAPVARNGQFDSAEAALGFMMAGNATVTLVSTRTQARFTYRVRASDDGAVHFVGLLNGPDNESQYAYIGYVKRGVYFHGGAKARVARDAASCKAFAWAFMMLSRGELPDTLEVWHEGKCGRCARKLTVPESIASGFGPECAGRMIAEAC